MRAQFRSEAVAELYTRHMHGDDPLNTAMRAVIAPPGGRQGAAGRERRRLKHVETFVIGEGVFIGAQSHLQGRFDGTFEIGDHVGSGRRATSTRAT
jgi:hypothetical protein